MTAAELTAAVGRLLDGREEQGLPPRVEDVAALEVVAAILRRDEP